jgi:hypothetical protein
MKNIGSICVSVIIGLKAGKLVFAEIGGSQDVRFGPSTKKLIDHKIFRNWPHWCFLPNKFFLPK